MNIPRLLAFLKDLQDNNNKEWMDAHRSRYQLIRNDFIEFLDELNAKLVATYPQYMDTPGKKAIERINNNLMFHPERPTYKSHFGATLDKVMKGSDYYLCIGLDECIIAGGMWHPDRDQLRNIREAIDYDGETLKSIIDNKQFTETFGHLFQRDRLKTAPQGFSADHPHIELLRLKSFAVVKDLNMAEITSPDLMDNLVRYYGVLSPFLQYLRKAINF